MQKSKKLTWQGIAIIVLALLLVLSLALGVSGAWFTYRKSGNATVNMDRNVTFAVKADDAVMAFVDLPNKLPGDKINGNISIISTDGVDGTVVPDMFLRAKITFTTTSTKKYINLDVADENGQKYQFVEANQIVTNEGLEYFDADGDGEYDAEELTRVYTINDYINGIDTAAGNMYEDMNVTNKWTTGEDNWLYYTNETTKLDAVGNEETVVLTEDDLILPTEWDARVALESFSYKIEVESAQVRNMTTAGLTELGWAFTQLTEVGNED